MVTAMAIKKKVLIVDDEVNFTYVLASSLSGEYETYIAHNGKEALEVLHSQRIDLVITDIRMPEMDGIELLANMTREFPLVPVIVLTAYGNSEIEAKLKNFKLPIHYLEKPIDLKLLKELIHNSISGNTEGLIGGVSLPSFLQLIEMERKTCKLRIHSTEGIGILHIMEGHLIDAELPNSDLDGLSAALEIIAWDSPWIEITNDFEKRAIKIDHPIHAIIMEAMRIKDEKKAKLRNIEEKEVEEKIDVVDSPPIVESSESEFLSTHNKEDEIMATKQEVIEKILAELTKIEGSEGAALIGRDGMLIASRFDKKYAEDKMAALVSQAVNTANKVIKEGQFGNPDNMLIEGTAGKMAIISSPNGSVFIALIGKPEMTLGMARLSLDEAMDELLDILK